MKKCLKNRKTGFTLVEMVLVIAIIVILAAVILLTISDYLDRAHNAADSVGRHNSEIDVAVGDIDGQMQNNDADKTEDADS